MGASLSRLCWSPLVIEAGVLGGYGGGDVQAEVAEVRFKPRKPRKVALDLGMYLRGLGSSAGLANPANPATLRGLRGLAMSRQ
ncbi:hypothetical protein HNR02_001212 [Amycolatopsis endophytica]|uniref:Uncharacterized protein n=1 Tax=Amycolatopsis endophytica TaxID=860233 RepID=A0A853AZ22_9PSEU|nr:hypothetical protein [Amycolatopsis endophytica]